MGNNDAMQHGRFWSHASELCGTPSYKAKMGTRAHALCRQQNMLSPAAQNTASRSGKPYFPI
ncbi:hypothetical protein [Herbaspirillum sp. CF444]|uniref:hypothetical protein n=1 Tax=Herbaspirillum sp. CF444 TaxID=1144319 RepID=UPI0012FA19DC|nr:hypothetical protein [Herbaspirillum sp. CF444]